MKHSFMKIIFILEFMLKFVRHSFMEIIFILQFMLEFVKFMKKTQTLIFFTQQRFKPFRDASHGRA